MPETDIEFAGKVLLLLDSPLIDSQLGEEDDNYFNPYESLTGNLNLEND